MRVANVAAHGKRPISCLWSFLRLSYPNTMLPILRTISVGGVLLAITILGLALIPPSRPHQQLADANTPARGALIDRGAHPEWRQFLIQSALKRAGEIERLRDLPGPAISVPSADVSQHTPVTTRAEDKVAGLPVARDDAEPDDTTGSVNVAPSATIPIDIGTTSSFELPITPVEEMPPVTTVPVVSATSNDAPRTETQETTSVTVEPPLSKVVVLAPAEEVRPEVVQAKPVVVIRKRTVRKPASSKTTAAAKPEITVPPPFSFIQAFFASLAANQANQNAASAQPAAAKRTIRRRPAIKPNQTAAAR